MSTNIGPATNEDGLVFGYDTGYPLVSASHETYRFNKGEPTQTFDVGTMVPESPTTFFSSSATYHNNLHGTQWDWSYFPDSNIHPSGGMEWLPSYPGPRDLIGAWKMKKRPGGNSESNFSGTAPGAITSSCAYTVSVWCQVNSGSTARIHINTTKDGSSFWGYASSQHNGDGTWKRMSVTIPADTGNTSINVIRCQMNGTTVTADAFWRDYQVEKRDHPTPFILGGTRSDTGSLIDLTGNIDIIVSNASFDSNAQLTFDGTDDFINLGNSVADGLQFQYTDNFSLEAWINPDAVTGFKHIIGITFSSYRLALLNNKISFRLDSNNLMTNAGTVVAGEWTHIVATWNPSTSTAKVYQDGALAQSVTDNTVDWTSQGTNFQIGNSPGESYYFPGQIAVGKVYSKTLTLEEISKNFNSTRHRFGV